jgi:hypothetical protein
MTLDFSKPETLQLRGGGEFRIYATDHCGICPVIGAVKGATGWHYQLWDRYGNIPCSNTGHPLDLIPKPLRVTGWLNVYHNGSGRFCTSDIFESQIAARKVASAGCLGQIHIDQEVQT